jgi:hypothetical protein
LCVQSGSLATTGTATPLFKIIKLPLFIAIATFKANKKSLLEQADLLTKKHFNAVPKL